MGQFRQGLIVVITITKIPERKWMKGNLMKIVGKGSRVIMTMMYQSMPRKMRSRIMLIKKNKGLMFQEQETMIL